MPIEIKLRWSPEEDEFLNRNHRRLQISRLAFRLEKSYEEVQERLVKLELLDPKKINRGKFYTDDEIEYQMLMDGCTEEEIAKERGTMRVFPTSQQSFGGDDDES